MIERRVRYIAREHGVLRTPPEPSRAAAAPVSTDDVVRAAREMVDAYGPAAGQLMRERMRALRRRGDSENALLWQAIAEAVDDELGACGAIKQSAAPIRTRGAPFRDGDHMTGVTAAESGL